MKAILCFGDSITHGRGVQPNFGWVYHLKKFYEKKGPWNVVYNLGIPGDKSHDLLYRIKEECSARVKLNRPGDSFTILIAIGMNDSRWLGLPSEKNKEVSRLKFKSNMQKILKIAGKYKAKVAVINITPVDESKTLPFEDCSYENARISQFNDLIQAACVKYDIPFLDIFSLMINSKHENLLSDGVHPNDAGYRFMFDKIKSFLTAHNLL